MFWSWTVYYERYIMNGIYAIFGLHERYIILVKVDEMYNILKSASHCLLVREMKMELDDQSFSGSQLLNVPTFTTPLFY